MAFFVLFKTCGALGNEINSTLSYAFYEHYVCTKHALKYDISKDAYRKYIPIWYCNATIYLDDCHWIRQRL